MGSTGGQSSKLDMVAIRSEFAVYGSPWPYLVVDDGDVFVVFVPFAKHSKTHPRSQRLGGVCRVRTLLRHGAMVCLTAR